MRRHHPVPLVLVGLTLSGCLPLIALHVQETHRREVEAYNQRVLAAEREDTAIQAETRTLVRDPSFAAVWARLDTTGALTLALPHPDVLLPLLDASMTREHDNVAEWPAGEAAAFHTLAGLVKRRQAWLSEVLALELERYRLQPSTTPVGSAGQAATMPGVGAQEPAGASTLPPPLLGPYRENVYGPGVHSDATGRPFTWQPQGGLPDPLLRVRPDAYGPGVGMDQYGRPVRARPLW